MAERSNEHEMKPVPCGCGGEAKVDWVLEPSNCYMANVFCNQCGTKTIPFWSTEKDKAIDYAVTTWNRAMSSAESERKKGEWIAHENYDECSKCHCFTSVGFNFCPNCGADMRGA